VPKVPFVVNDIEVDGTTLTVDETNNRVGVGTNTPGVTLDVVGVLKASDGVITLTSAGTPSATIADGALAVDTTNDKLFIRSGSAWVEVGGGGGATDHGALTGLADDDHTQYLLTNGTRAATALDVNGDSTFDGDFAVTIDTAGNVQSFRVGTSSKVIFNVNDWGVGAGLSPVQLDAASLNVSPSDAANLGIRVKGLASQTNNLTQWENSSGTVIAQVDAAGEISSTGLDVTGNIIVSGTVDGRDIATDGAIIDAAVTSSDVDDIVEISQASYTALGSGRPAGRLYLITS